ncbi:hypothetical protein [Agrilutibacter niabensis]
MLIKFGDLATLTKTSQGSGSGKRGAGNDGIRQKT